MYCMFCDISITGIIRCDTVRWMLGLSACKLRLIQHSHVTDSDLQVEAIIPSWPLTSRCEIFLSYWNSLLFLVQFWIHISPFPRTFFVLPFWVIPWKQNSSFYFKGKFLNCSNFLRQMVSFAVIKIKLKCISIWKLSTLATCSTVKKETKHFTTCQDPVVFLIMWLGLISNGFILYSCQGIHKLIMSSSSLILTFLFSFWNIAVWP